MDLKLESSEDFRTVSQFEDELSNLKLVKCSNKSDGCDENGLCNGNFCFESDSDASKLLSIFTNGVSDTNYYQFCDLFSKVLYKPSIQSYMKPDNNDHTSELSRELDINNFVTFDNEDFGLDDGFDYNNDHVNNNMDKDNNNGDIGYDSDKLDTVYWEYLEWLVNVFDELNRFESLGFGINFLINNLKRFTDNLNVYKDSRILENVEKFKKLIDFINVFRDANSSIYTTYALLDRMETKLNNVRYKSIKILQLKLNNKSKFISSNNHGVTSPITNPFDQFDNTPINTPSSTTTSMSDRGEMDLLYEIWDSKLCKLRLLAFKRFRYYLISVVRQLKEMYHNFNYYQLVQFIVYTHLTNNNMENNSSSKENMNNNDNNNNSSSIEYSNQHEGDYYKDKGTEEHTFEEDNEDILEYLNKYYSIRNMNEEKADSYVSRIKDLNSRLIPKFVKIIGKLPIYYEAFLNALICNNIQDGMFQLISSSGNSSYKDNYKEFYRESYKDNNNRNNNSNNKENNTENNSLREEKVEHKSWIHKIDVVKVLNKTNLEVVDAVRCSFNNSRKLVIFSQGSLKDLFNNFSNYKDNYNNKDYNNCSSNIISNYRNNSTNNNKEYYNYKEYNKDYNKDMYNNTYKDNIIIKNDNKDGSYNKIDKDDEILKRIYYCNNNLSEVASREIEKVIVQHIPIFSWSPKIVKHQLSLQYQHNNYDYNMNQDLDYNNIYNIDNIGIIETNRLEYIEYIKLEEKIWMNRLNMFNRINERNIRNYLMKRNNNTINKIKYESSNLLINNKIPFIVLLDYNNYIPIKYIYNENNNNNKEKENNSSNNDGDKEEKEDNTNNKENYNKQNNKETNKNTNKDDSDDKDWLIRLFNTNNNNRIFKNNCIDIEIERDLFPGFYLFNNYKLNCFILPIHENNFQSQESFVNFSKILQNKIDLMYPSYLQQINHFILSNNNINSSNNTNYNKDNKFNGKYGDYFVTYHTNLSIGNKDRMVINFVFHLVCCDTSVNDDISPIEYAEDTEVILKHVKKIEPILNGLGKILKVCNELKIQTIHLPASLKCCYKINQHNNNNTNNSNNNNNSSTNISSNNINNIIQSDFYNYHNNNYNHYNNQMNNTMGLNSKESIIECNNDYVRCLAVVSHLASLLNKNKYCIKNINLIFPQHLNQTLLPKTSVNIFTTRVNTF